MRRKCRIWWPKQLPLAEIPTNSLLFGWSMWHSSVSIDIVVAFVSDNGSSSNCPSRLQDILHKANEKMPASLKETATFTVIGHYDACMNANGDAFNKIVTGGMTCGCHQLNEHVENLRKDSMASFWIHMTYSSKLHSSPRLHHIHWNGQIVSQCDVHVIAYDTPVYGSHHFSLGFLSSSPKTKPPLKKPKWVDELHHKQPLCNIETVILSINCVSAVKTVYKRCMQLEASPRNLSIGYMIFSLASQFLAAIVASASTLYYGFIIIVCFLSRFPLFSWMFSTSEKVLKNTWINLRIRSFQIFYWPILLQENDIRSISCVEHLEKSTLQRHSMWSAIAVDVVLGNMIGLGLLFHTDAICLWMFNFAKEFTNGILRSGCVWLMGVPAGFKLNTELAGVLGMVSLNVIQIWSTLWFIMASFLFYAIRSLAVVGIAFGATVAASLVIDIITFATLHVSVLHHTITFLYSHQIQALAALWRLFRGRKLNPLRQRLDSYGYTVKQHVLGSLLFTPLLLLLPTTLVFFIFFTIMRTAISSICMLIEITIAIIHATPYTKIIVWIVRRRRFPCGVWFQIDHREDNNLLKSPEIEPLLVSTLLSNFLTIGQILLPHYKTIFSGISSSSIATSAHGILTGKRMPSRLGLCLPPTNPLVFMSCREYWRHCYDSIISSILNGNERESLTMSFLLLNLRN